MLRILGAKCILHRCRSQRLYTVHATVDPFSKTGQKTGQKKKRNTTPAYRFIDRTRVTVKAGDGGKGSLSFCHIGRSFKKKPDGGHGGNGGSVVIIADEKEQTLRWSKSHQYAEDGTNGAGQNMIGGLGHNLILKVPCGTIVRRVLDYDEEWDEQNWMVKRSAGSARIPTGGEFVIDDQGGVEYVYHYDDDFEDIDLFQHSRPYKSSEGEETSKGDSNSQNANDFDRYKGKINKNVSSFRVDSSGHRILGEIDPEIDMAAEDSDKTDSDTCETDSDSDEGEDWNMDSFRVDSAGHRILGEVNPENDTPDENSDETDSDSDDEGQDLDTGSFWVDSAGHRIHGEVNPEESDFEDSDETDSDTEDEEDNHSVYRKDSAGHRILGVVSPEGKTSQRDSNANVHDSDYGDDSDNEDREREMVTLADLDKPGSYVVVARGGQGGTGNCAFATRHGPIVPAEMIRKSRPRKGEQAFLELELKLIADIGLVGFPNAGKSSLLAALSKATPKIAPYPFTTLHPLIGVIEYRDEYKVVAADVPGLIAGASLGRGKGHDFLRHLERTKALLYMVDSAGTDGRNPYDDLRVLVQELAAYGDGDMLTRPALVVANKLDLLSEEEGEEFTLELGCIAEEMGIRFDGNVFGISAGVTGQGLGLLSRAIRNVVRDGEIQREQSFQQGAYASIS